MSISNLRRKQRQQLWPLMNRRRQKRRAWRDRPSPCGCQTCSHGLSAVIYGEDDRGKVGGEGSPLKMILINLSDLEVPDNVIQRILRHSDVATTQKHYRKALPKSARKAMQKLDRSLKTGQIRAS